MRCRQLAVWAAASLWIALAAGMLGRYLWPLDLFAHFRVQYAVLFVLIAVLLWIFKRRMLSVVSLAGAVVSAVPLMAYLAPGTGPSASASSPHFRVITFNAWIASRDIRSTADFLRRADADAIVLQELPAHEVMELRERLSSYPYWYIEPLSSRVAILSRWPIREAVPFRSGSGGIIGSRVALDWMGQRIQLLGVHLHWPLSGWSSRLRNEELRSIAAWAREQQDPVLVAGDFNITPWSAHFAELLSRSGLRDCAQGEGLRGSWPAQLPLFRIRIDHCLASAHFRTVEVRVGPMLRSDHLPVSADLIFDATRDSDAGRSSA
jgi:endonuclease/exonuclease/phosphatase (EEP) superfamily protein YafD